MHERAPDRVLADLSLKVTRLSVEFEARLKAFEASCMTESPELMERARLEASATLDSWLDARKELVDCTIVLLRRG